MKFQLKALAAAAILAASIPAHATLDANNLAPGNGSFVLTILDTANNISASFDLGINYLNFNQVPAAGAVSSITAPGTTLTWNLAANGLNNGVQGDYASAWSLLTTGNNLSTAKFGIVAADGSGAAAGARGYITSYVSSGGALGGTPLVNAVIAQQTYMGNVSAPAANLFTNHLTVANGASVAANGTAGYAIPYYNGDANSNGGPIALGNVGGSVGVAQLVTGTSALSPQTIFANATFSLSNTGVLTYAVAAVPEADTWAMMMLGLGFMGFVARRKQA